ncbi:double-strand break repair protein AddB [Roseivivax lentus]|uniref:Double-strand break repair protein AddB n=1 Tax=Roseivivax lentus TaxID=633194 RepID=A0A1N7JSL8_9RHOB|nr:double-strand break repair protein AddB [Roseivivax lentus]SIS52369.1 double-strand break repair protein AddB [Roseivivax lentus]
MIFDGHPTPRLFALPPGTDFPAALMAGLRARFARLPPEAIARAELMVNTQRMKRRLEQLFTASGPGFLPRITLVTDPTDPALRATLPPAVPALRRRLELTGLISGLLDQAQDLAPRAALFDLADSLAALMDEMQIEGVPPDKIAGLDVSDQSGHWERALQFVRIVQRYFDAADPAPDMAALQRRAVEMRIARWQAAPPDHPVILAGSTGSRGTTHALMQAVARLPQGAVVLPGFDTDMPRHVWDQLTDDLPRADHTQPGEDHPQYRFARLLRDLGASPPDVADWGHGAPPVPARNALVSLALRPAPVTDQWLTEGPGLPDLMQATADVTLLEAPDPRREAVAIAMRLREAAETGQSAALITPDRNLSRQVSAALDRWGIVADDSAGLPAQVTPPGRLLRQVAQLLHDGVTAESLLALLKHPLCHAGDDPGEARSIHTRAVPELEAHIRRNGMPYPDRARIEAWPGRADHPGWTAWLADVFCRPVETGIQPLSHWVATHIALAEVVVAGSAGGGHGALWDKEAGRALRSIMDELQAEAAHGTALSARDYADLFGAILARGEVRNPDAVHPHIRIWGTIEARVMGADLMILGGLNEGSWPEMPKADPWLNRRMRADAGLTLPERRIGLSAHDFQQAVAAREVWLTRAVKSADADTVPSRWLNRIVNLMKGLPERGGPDALDGMKRRGKDWLARAALLETPLPSPPARRPSPKPPETARPRSLRLTQVKTLIRDPFTIYARAVLRLEPLNPLMQAPDALLRGIVVHDAMKAFGLAMRDHGVAPTPATFLTAIEDELARAVPFPLARQLWQARFARVAEGFARDEKARQARAALSEFEIDGSATLPALGFTLTTRADRIDLDARGGAHLYDYKTGKPPGEKEQLHFDKQLLLTAAMVEKGAFREFAPRHIADARFIGLGASGSEVAAPLDKAPPGEVWAGLERLIARYLDAGQGFTARRAMFSDKDRSDFDHLSRLGEWDLADDPLAEVLE